MNGKWRGALPLVSMLLVTACGGGGKEEPTPPIPPSVSSSSLPWGTTGVAYSATLAATGGTTPYSWSVSAGSLPAGLSLAAATGIISGTPTAAGSSSFTVRVGDSSSPQLSGTKDLSITVVDPLLVTTAALAEATMNVAYAATLAASGGTTPYSWSLASGTLPAGLTLGAGGAISGTSTVVGTSTFTVRVTDSSTPARTQTRSLSITVQPPPGGLLAITTTAMPLGTTGTAYSFTLQATGGTAPRTWSVVGGYQLPPGLTLNQSTGAISGTPTTQGVTQVAFQVSDVSLPPQTDGALLSIEVRYASILTATTSSLPLATAGQAYSAQLETSGGTAPRTWSVVGGYQLPPGLTLNQSTGAISGTPTTQGATQVSFQVTDASLPPQTDYALLSIDVRYASILTATTSSLPLATAGQAYSAQLGAGGGTAPRTWSVMGGYQLPPGLTLNPSTGAISGTPTTQGVTQVQFQVTDTSLPPQADYALLAIEVRYPSIVTATTSWLPVARTGQPYAAQLQAVGGTGHYAWSLMGGYQLPAGLTLNGSTGAISGTPSTQGLSQVQFQVTDTSLPAQVDYALLAIFVDQTPVFRVTTSRMPTFTVGQSYAIPLQAENGTPPYTWSVASGSLPTGLGLDPSTGVVSGTPDTMGSFSVQIQVSDSSSPPETSAIMIFPSVRYPSLLAVTTSRLPAGTVGTPYDVQLRAEGGTPPYTWSVASGSLPTGLGLDPSTGVVSGTPDTMGSFSVQIQVSDSSSPAQTSAVIIYASVRYQSILAVTTARLPPGIEGTPYDVQLRAEGGTPPYTWSVASGTLPGGLSLDPGSGVVSGTPTTMETTTVMVQAADSSSPSQAAAVILYPWIRYESILTVTTAHLPAATAGVPYSVQLSAGGGTPPYTWSVSSGSLPAGLAVDAATGVISGTPSGPGSSAFQVQAADASSPAQQAAAILYLDVI